MTNTLFLFCYVNDMNYAKNNPLEYFASRLFWYDCYIIGEPYEGSAIAFTDNVYVYYITWQEMTDLYKRAVVVTGSIPNEDEMMLIEEYYTDW